MADWEKCQVGLYWSANHNEETWGKHSDSLKEYVVGDEADAFDQLKDIHDAEDMKDAFEACRESNKTEFWKRAQSVFLPTGPRKDV